MKKTLFILWLTMTLSCILDSQHTKFLSKQVYIKTLKNFVAPFYGWGSTASRLEPLRGHSLLFTTKLPEIPGTHFIDLGG